ncbi:protein SLOW WALKER 1 [Nymphaea colorata]|nr:protein SLOW WALKER 1 [Nymphaea colorata]XP_031473971.1 protein SLOW WALKER 1 [Nymphaea colorata]XP_031473972.1 protein SLOW WALKER 1 [Nymphaea colorata]XP_031473973.1 protein SLOW WALKER 1 [Nymphaea colorata]XP_031473974.1 protein SLOW WALKER 1 [Nymphaea colorata]XP_031473975.1 protein SLOW WALKER 1 [Nymphaea colorata]XP_031473977.1 protein SLOW WALKER 1 [Nymphaea colorata]XP_031473979.1 protein SLOW WALKER 1 [Nymphaea colorata]XP_031473981.1 protein SLOW WALKER 1 [Nymphaea colorata]XP
MEGPGKFIPTNPRLQPPKKQPDSSPESNYWRSFKTRQLTLPRLSSSAVSFVHFSPAPPHDFVLTSSASLTLFSSSTLRPISSITDFPDVAFSGAFRFDGKLVAAGCQSGVVQVFDATSRLALRRLEGHARPVRFVRYPLPSSGDKLHLLSAGDDALVKWWDVSTGTEVLTFTGHRDYVRSGSPSPTSAHLWATGSYDHTVRVWDIRRPESSVLSVNHGAPVEAVLFLPSGGWMATAGANSVKIWDVISGGKMIHSMENHNKTVTALSLGKFSGQDGVESTRIFSVSLDGYLKVFDYSNFKVTHTSRFPFPLLSVDSSPSSLVRAIGTANGVAFVSKRKNMTEADGDSAPSGAEGLLEEKKRTSKARGFRYFERGQNEKPSGGDFMVQRPEKVKLAEHDRLLKKFRHKEALVSVLRTNDPMMVVAVMEELVARNKLIKCLTNLNSEEELGLLLGFLHRFTTMPRYARFLMAVARKILTQRANDIGSSPALRKHLAGLKATVAEEIKIQNSLMEIQGMISPLLSIAGR